MQITSADMQKFGHKDDWGVDCLYLADVQALFADKLLEADEILEAAKLSRAEVEAFEDRMKGRLS